MKENINRVQKFSKFINENNDFDNKVELFKKEFKDLLLKYNIDIYADSIGEGFTSEIVIDMDDKEIIRITDIYDIK
ncbi:MAG: hypothetical protein RBT65_17650 [Methanolobus sp.]|jgi:hypothetical protein|nr:hypothetical protein [Methanolobus sp.]